MTVSTAKLAPQTVTLAVASYAVLIAAASNTLSKLCIGIVVGRGRFGLELAAVTAACILAAAATLGLVRMTASAAGLN